MRLRRLFLFCLLLFFLTLFFCLLFFFSLLAVGPGHLAGRGVVMLVVLQKRQAWQEEGRSAPPSTGWEELGRTEPRALPETPGSSISTSTLSFALALRVDAAATIQILVVNADAASGAPPVDGTVSRAGHVLAGPIFEELKTHTGKLVAPPPRPRAPPAARKPRSAMSSLGSADSLYGPLE